MQFFQALVLGLQILDELGVDLQVFAQRAQTLGGACPRPSNRAAATRGCWSISPSSALRDSTAACTGDSVVQLAERSAPSSKAISPMMLPGPGPGPGTEISSGPACAPADVSTDTSPSSSSR